MTENPRHKDLPRSHKQNILELLRDTYQTVEEISLELKCDMAYAHSAVKQLETAGLVIKLNDAKPFYYTSDYSKLKIQVHQCEYDQYELVIPVSTVEVKRDPLVELFFSEPPVTIHNENMYYILEVSQKQFDKVNTSMVIYPFTEDAKFLKTGVKETEHLATIFNLKINEVFTFYDCFKVIVRK